ncbi:hypothetical protein, partial [Actinacidiphila glaucinigra]|uniref:hypothetical protein n=1 Tax=Actinacidiphila glaucinigra TaxID=235986 RepID=UPI0035D7FC07
MTLLTGDKVTIAPGTSSGPGVITVEGPDGKPVGARVVTVGVDTYVYPDSVQPYLAQNVSIPSNCGDLLSGQLQGGVGPVVVLVVDRTLI